MHAEVRYPVNLILNRSLLTTGQWQHPRWTVVSILPASSEDSDTSASVTQIHAAGRDQDFLWHGLWLGLFRDGLQAYYENLTGRRPSLFVLCHEQDEIPDLAPISVSASLADAEAHMESDGTVLACPLTTPFSGWLANYVLQNRVVFENQLDRMHRDKKGGRRHA